MLLENDTIQKWIKHASFPYSTDLSFLGEDEFITKCPAIYNDVTLNHKQKYKKNCEFERYWGLHYKKIHSTAVISQTSWTGWLGEHLFKEYCEKHNYKYSCRPKTTKGSQP